MCPRVQSRSSVLLSPIRTCQMRYRWLSVTPAVTVMSASQKHFTRTCHWLQRLIYIHMFMPASVPMLVLVFAFAVCTAAKTLHEITQCDLSCTSQLSLCWVCANIFTEGGYACRIQVQHLLFAEYSRQQQHLSTYLCKPCQVCSPMQKATPDSMTVSGAQSWSPHVPQSP